jgi:hypothetical protein
MSNAAYWNSVTRAMRNNPHSAGTHDGYEFGFQRGMDGLPLKGARAGAGDADPRLRRNPRYRAAFNAAVVEGYKAGIWTYNDTQV